MKGLVLLTATLVDTRNTEQYTEKLDRNVTVGGVTGPTVRFTNSHLRYTLISDTA